MTLFINAHLIIWYVNYDSASVSYWMTLKFSKIWEIRECGDQYRGYHGSESCIRIDDGWMARLDTKMRDEDILNNIKVCQQIPNMPPRYHTRPLMYFNPLSSVWASSAIIFFLIMIIGWKWSQKFVILNCYVIDLTGPFWVNSSHSSIFLWPKWSIFQ